MARLRPRVRTKARAQALALAVVLSLAIGGCASLRPVEGPAVTKRADGRQWLRISGAPSKGDRSAPVVVIELGDFQCPVSARHLREVMPELEEAYVRTGNVRYVFFDFPLTTIHPRAFPAAIAARCAGAQGKFWELHDRLLENQRSLDEAGLDAQGQAVELDLDSFRECRASGKYRDAIQRDVAAGTASDVRGTPTFLIGLPVEGEADTIQVEERIPGVSSYRNFAMILDRVLQRREPQAR